MSKWVEHEDGSRSWFLTEEEYDAFLEDLDRAAKLDDLPGGWSREATLVLK
jgi:hypothetical protein